MADDILSSFLVKVIFDQDERSRKKFDEGLKQVQTHAAEFGAKIGELPTIVTEATKRISSSLSEMYYAAQKNGATARELDALRYAAKQSGEGADKAEASFNAFSQRIAALIRAWERRQHRPKQRLPRRKVGLLEGARDFR